MWGHAFRIEDALLAMRWAEQIRPRGYHIAITPCYGNAEEVIEVSIPGSAKSTFRIYRVANSVRVMDCLGLTLSFPALMDALLLIDSYR